MDPLLEACRPVLPSWSLTGSPPFVVASVGVYHGRAAVPCDPVTVMEIFEPEVWQNRADNHGMTPNEALQVLDWLYRSRINYCISTFWGVRGCGYAATLGLSEDYLP